MRLLIRLSLLLSLFFLISTLYAAPADRTFSSSEHLTAGEQLTLRFTTNSPGEKDHLFQLDNGLEVSYGDMLTFGDLYGIPTQVISSGKTPEERQSFFRDAFNTFATDKNAVSEAKQIMVVIHTEQQIVENGIKNGEEPEKIYSGIENETSRQLNCITGGGCSSSSWWLKPGRYLNLALTNYDHFGDDALLAYHAGHVLAIKEALLAYKTKNIKHLEAAYAMNAYASHFLSDRFAAGHLRTPRKELAQHVTPETVGSALSNYMHNEENEYGLHVHNAKGDHWVSYGDTSYYSRKNDDNRTILHTALQASADHLFAIATTGITSIDPVFSLVPVSDEKNNNAQYDVSPLFYWDADNQLLMRRVDMTNVFDKNWTSNWWGWSTLLELNRERGKPSLMIAALASSPYAEKARQAGLI